MNTSKNNPEFDFYHSKHLTLKVDKKGLVCYLKIKQNYDAISEKELLELLDKAKVIHGFENAKTNRKTENDFITIALADSPNNFIQPDFYTSIPVYENIGLEDIKKMPFVKKNQIIGSLITTKNYTSSLNIFGKPNLNISRTDINTDDNFIITSNEIIAKENGYLYKELSGKLRLVTQYTEEKDVFKKIISLKIPLIFKKDVLASVIESTKDITILGTVRDCKKIFSGQNITIASAIDSKILASDSITFTGKITDCKIVANNKIVGIENSKFISGNIISGKIIEIQNVYKKSSETSLEIALAPVNKELLKLKKEKEITLPNVKKLLNEIEKEFYNFGNSNDSVYIKINEKVTPNVYLRIYKKSHIIKKEQYNFIFS